MPRSRMAALAFALWPMLHPFECTERVLQYVRESGGFADPGVEPVRGGPRPADGKYASQLADADPLRTTVGGQAL